MTTVKGSTTRGATIWLVTAPGRNTLEQVERAVMRSREEAAKADALAAGQLKRVELSADSTKVYLSGSKAVAGQLAKELNPTPGRARVARASGNILQKI